MHVQGEKYDESVDIWAIGIIMYELLVGKPRSKHRYAALGFADLSGNYCFWTNVFFAAFCRDKMRPSSSLLRASCTCHPWCPYLRRI